jgi:hypothetical protein
MSAKNSQAKILSAKKGSMDAPYMVIAAIALIVFVTVIGIFLGKNLLDVQRHASSIDGAEKLYNAADLLSAGALGSTRTLYVRLPVGYSIILDGNVSLRDANGVVGVPLHISGVELEGPDIASGKRHLKLEYLLKNGKSTVAVSEIT